MADASSGGAACGVFVTPSPTARHPLHPRPMTRLPHHHGCHHHPNSPRGIGRVRAL